MYYQLSVCGLSSHFHSCRRVEGSRPTAELSINNTTTRCYSKQNKKKISKGHNLYKKWLLLIQNSSSLEMEVAWWRCSMWGRRRERRRRPPRTASVTQDQRPEAGTKRNLQPPPPPSKHVSVSSSTFQQPLHNPNKQSPSYMYVIKSTSLYSRLRAGISLS